MQNTVANADVHGRLEELMHHPGTGFERSETDFWCKSWCEISNQTCFGEERVVRGEAGDSEIDLVHIHLCI